MSTRLIRSTIILCSIAAAIGCRGPEQSSNAQRTVTVYVSTDRVFSEPVLREYEKQSGVRVNTVYDTEDNDHIDLGGPVEFRSSIEVSYALNRWTRLGVYVAHLSNASIYSRNRGAETAGLALSFDLGGWAFSD